jgi:hypothetical protein
MIKSQIKVTDEEIASPEATKDIVDLKGNE